MSGNRVRRARLAALMVAAGFLACLAAGCGAGTGPSPVPGARGSSGHGLAGRPVPAQVTVAATARRAPIPRSFLGISTEYWALPQWAGQMSLLERALSLVHVRGDGPLLLRIGGDSADHSFWDPSATPMPVWAFTLAPRWLRQARALVRALPVRLMLDLNLITDTPAAAAQWARAAQAGLPRGTISTFEVGNEPDIYSQADWRAITANRRLEGRVLPGPSLPAVLDAHDYARDFRTYATALASVAPRAMLGGPALANPTRHRAWLATLIRDARRSLGVVTIHRYPYSGCPRRRGTPSYATIDRVLSPAASTGMAAALAPLADEAHDAGLPLRLTELNSVNCGGRPGVSDTFATALWAPDALFALLRAGVDGVNVHVRADAVNAAFALTPAGLIARPLLYGLVLFADTLGPRAQLVTVSAHPARRLNLATWAVRDGPNALRVLLVDKGRRSARVSLRLPASAPASVQRLLAPAVTSTTGVTLAGRHLGSGGQWQGVPAYQTLAPRGGAYVLDVHAMSAALVSVRLRPGALGAAAARGRSGAAATRGRRRRGARSAPAGARSRPR